MDFDPEIKTRSRFLKTKEKDGFQNELQDTLRKRNSRFATAEYSDDDGVDMGDDSLFPSPSSRFMKSKADRDGGPGRGFMTSGGWNPGEQQATTSYSRSPRGISPTQVASPRSPPKLSPGRSGERSAEEIIFGKKGTYSESESRKKPSDTWSPPSYKKVNFKPTAGDDEEDEYGYGSGDLGRTARPGVLEKFRTLPASPLQDSRVIEEEDEEKDLKFIKPNPRKKSSVKSDDTFGKTNDRRKSALLGLDSDDETDKSGGLHDKRKDHYSRMYKDDEPSDKSKSSPRPMQRSTKFRGPVDRQSSKDSSESRSPLGRSPPLSRSPTGSDRRTSRTPSPTKRDSVADDGERESPGRRTSVLDFLQGGPKLEKVTEERPKGKQQREQSPGKGEKGPRQRGSPQGRAGAQAEKRNSASPKPLDFGPREQKASGQREGSPLFAALSGDAELESRKPGRQRSLSPVEKKPVKSRKKDPKSETSDFQALLSNSSSVDRRLRKQKGVDKGSSSRSSSSSSSDSDRPRREPLQVLPEPPRRRDPGHERRPVCEEKQKSHDDERSSICEELDRDPISVVQDSYKKEELKKERQKRMEFQTVEHQSLERAIDSVADEQNLASTSTKTTKLKEKSGQFTDITPKVITRPRSALNSTESSDMSLEGSANFNDSISLRQSIYDSWYRTKLEQARLKRREEKKKQEEEKKNMKKELEDKKAEKTANYEGWLKKKQPFFAEQVANKKSEKMKNKNLKEEKKQKEEESEKYFNDWREKKSQKIKEKEKQKRREEIQRKTEDKDEAERKKKDAEKAFESWKNSKDEILKSGYKEKKKNSKEEAATKKELVKKRDEEARIAFEKWEMEQEKRKIQQREYMNRSMSLQNSRRAWRPNSRTVMEKH